VQFENQAQFYPTKSVAGLAQTVSSASARSAPTLLCEQVVGRGLRRQSHDLFDIE
jgi:hypothetical protein